jgi:hypothetical protein
VLIPDASNELISGCLLPPYYYSEHVTTTRGRSFDSYTLEGQLAPRVSLWQRVQVLSLV